MTIAIEAIRKAYGRKTVIERASHEFSPGLTLLVGPSGAGKSTLLRLLATAEKPSGGTIRWQGVALPRARQALRKVLGYAPQAVELPEDLTAREFVRHIAALKGLSQGQADTQFLAIADAIALNGDVNTRIGSFSGGMRRRLIFAQALLGSPRLLALDEPTAELDGETAARVNALIRDRAQQATVVMTTHLSDALAAQAQVLRVADGSLIAQ